MVTSVVRNFGSLARYVLMALKHLDFLPDLLHCDSPALWIVFCLKTRALCDEFDSGGVHFDVFACWRLHRPEGGLLPQFCRHGMERILSVLGDRFSVIFRVGLRFSRPDHEAFLGCVQSICADWYNARIQ